MNERIQALINQSWQTVEGTPREGMEDIRQALMEDLNPVFLEFARLIAQECARLAMTQHCSTSPADYSDMEPYEQGCDDTASRISGLIRRTFRS